MIQYFPIVTGSLTVLGNINVSGSITTSGSITISGSITSASFASTASYWSGSIVNAGSASFASTASFVALAQSASNAVSAVTASFANNLTVAGTLTAQTLVVQTITSSVDFVTGSTRFGSSLSTSTHQFTGSVSITGSLDVITNGTEFQVTSTGVKFGNVIGDAHNITGSVGVSGSATFLGNLTVSGFGSNAFSAGGTGYNRLILRNTTAGAANGAQLSVGSDADPDQLYIQSFSTTFTTSGMNVAGGAVINGEGPGGLNLAATQANIGFYTNGSSSGNLRMAISSSGDVTFGTGMRISQVGSNTIGALTSNLILYSTGYNVYIRPASGYEAIIDSGNGLNVTGKTYSKSGGGSITPSFTTLFTMEGFSTYIITMHTGTGDGTYGIHTAIYDSADLVTAVLSGNNISSQISGTDFQIKSNNGATYGLTWTALRIK